MELWHDYTFYSFIFLNSEKNEPGIITSFLLTSFFSTPSVLWTLPLYRCTTQGERRFTSITFTTGVFNPSPRRYAPQFSPIFSCTTPRNASGHGRGRRLNTNDFLSPPKIVSDARDALRLFILLSSEKNEPRSAAAVIGLLARRYGRRRGLRNSLRSDSPRPFSSVFLATSPPDKGGIGGLLVF